MPEAQTATQMLTASRAGSREALDSLFSLLYDELRRIAHRQLAGRPGDGTLNTTALINEAYLRMIDQTIYHMFRVCEAWGRLPEGLDSDRAMAALFVGGMTHAMTPEDKLLELNEEPQIKPFVDLPLMANRAQEMLRGALDAFVRRDATTAAAYCFTGLRTIDTPKASGSPTMPGWRE